MGVTLLLAALLAQAPVDATPTIVGVELRLPSGADSRLLDRAPSLVTVRKGQRLSRRAVARSIESLFATDRFADIEVLAEAQPDGINLVFSLTPRQNVGAIFVEGAVQVTPDELRAATGLELGAAYWPERLERSAEKVRQLYERRGFRSADVKTEAISLEGAITVAFVVKEGEPSRLRSVTVSGEPGMRLEPIVKALGLKPGDVMDLARIESGVEQVRAFYRRERYFRAKVDAAELTDDGRLTIPIVSGARYDVVFSGNRVVTDNELRSLLGYDGEEALDSMLGLRLAQRLERFYRFRGYHDVRVASSEVRQGRERAALGFAIEEGLPVRVVSIDFVGAQIISPDELRNVLKKVIEASTPVTLFGVHGPGDATLQGSGGSGDDRVLPAPPGDTVLEENAWVEAAKAMTALYRERGYLRASVTFSGAEISQGLAIGSFTIVEGPRALFHQVEAQGLPDGFSSESLGTVQAGSPFSPEALKRLERDLGRELGRKGYLFAEVEGSYTLDDTGKRADAVLLVSPGPQVRVRAVLPVGQVRTAEDIITAQATMREGLPLDSESLFSTQANLTALGVFRNVQVEMLSPDRPEPLKTVVLRVRERPLFSAEGFLGYFYADGLRGGVEGALTNLGGRGITLTGRAQGNLFFTSVPALSGQVDLSKLELYQRMGGRLNLSLDARSVLPAGLGLRFDVVAERVFRPQFRFSRFLAVPTLDWSHVFEVPRIDWLRPKLSVALQYEAEWSFVERVGTALSSLPPVSLVDQERLRFLFGEFALHGGRLNLALDLRDNALTPRRGLLLQGSGELTGAISTRDEAGNPVPVSFVKVSGLATGYVPLGERLVLAVSARGGRIFPLLAGSTTPPVRRFFLGGATSVRGFNEDQLVAEDSRQKYREQVRDCQVLASKAGCSSAANTVLAGRQVPSQGGELFALFKTELRFPAFSVFDLGVFFETGNLWLAVPETLTFRPVVGAGVRYVTPIGPLALDLGWNLDPDVVINEPRFVVHFNIGVF